jgi:hypothetical protein
MLSRRVGKVERVWDWDNAAQEVTTEHGVALNYIEISGRAEAGDDVLLNATAGKLSLGTGGYDFVMANLTRPAPEEDVDLARGHIVKLRYTPEQHAVRALEEMPEHAGVWEWELEGLPVIVGQLHSQIAPVAAGLKLRGKRVVYVMTDGAALPIAFSRLTRQLKSAGLIDHTTTCGQAFGGDYETVTVHSALLAAKHILKVDAAIVCQGPGNAGTATRYGFSGIEQATLLGTAKALEGKPIAVVRMSEADERDRHRGISHHTKTALDLTYARCIVPVPAGFSTQGLPPGHDIRFVDGVHEALDLLKEKGIEVTTMGRGVNDDPAFFAAAAAAGMVDV